MYVSISPSELKGSVQAPASKSSMQRALAAALLTKGKSIIHNPGHSNDDKAAKEIIIALGAEVKELSGEWRVASRGMHPVSSEINCGESGLSIRMFTPIAALSEKEIIVTGSGSILSRPMDFFDEILPKLGVKIKSNKGKLPIVIQGPIRPTNIEIDGSLSSQFLTGLLMAYAAADACHVTIKVNDLKSKPYIDLTLEVMRQFGLKLPVNNSYAEFYFDRTNHEQVSQDHEYTVEGDWSGGAFLLVAGAIAGPVTVKGLDVKSTQADKKILDALALARAGISIEGKNITVDPGELKGFVFDASDCPDLFPPLVALAAYCKGRTTIYGVSRLLHKESNRALTLQDEFDKMGVLIKLERDEMLIQGNGRLKAADIYSHHDHRIAMACSVAALKAEGTTVIEEAMAVSKSYPGFYDDLKKLGAVLSLSLQPFNL
ncbi:MAG TPA: 3-phosphoshikimate 1-carboxyvinyltransferase [Chitinophagaceae bacterium]|nr:3-phosphoshikimate 1-carboxyvinyltransferase [Chitinophagaceae bacterium]